MIATPLWAANALKHAEFQSPPAEARIAPFWFWNGAMDVGTVRRQVRQMFEGGCGGFFIHPRQGLTLPYLSAEWFARVRIAVEEAARWGLQVWLYDEYPYPSGIAGGLVTANKPDVRARTLHYEHFQAEDNVALRREFPLGRMVCARAYPVLEGQTQWDESLDLSDHLGVVLTGEQFWLWPMAHIPYNEKRFMADEGRLVLAWKPPTGTWQVCVGIEREQRGFKYYDCFFDPLHPDAAPEFLCLTHERYAQELGEYFGTTIPGIFTDETEPPAWSPHLEAALRAAGLDLSELLPALHHDDHPRASELRVALRRHALQLFYDRWEKPVAHWCSQHHLLWSAEKPIWRPSQFGVVAQPATDAGHRRTDLPPEPLTADLRANHRAAMSAAEHQGASVVRCECFHSLGWGATLQDQKWAIDWLCAQGVNRFTPHAFYATTAGLAKHDAAPSFFAENPYWPHYRQLAGYTARLSYAMSRGRERARIALLHPTTALWSGGPAAQRVRADYEWLMNALLAEHHQFHIVDALEIARITLLQGALTLGNARYEVLLVPPLAIVDEDTLRTVQEAVSANLTVLVGAPPGSHNELTTLSGVTTITERSQWLEQLGTQRPLSVADESGRELSQVWALWREVGEQELLFLTNTSADAVNAHLGIKTEAKTWEQWSLETAEVAAYPAQHQANKSQIAVALPPFGSCLLVGSNAAQEPLPVPALPRTHPTLILPTEGDWQLTLDYPNALRLNRWRVASTTDECSSPDFDDSVWPECPALPLRYLDQVAKRWVETCPRVEGAPVWYRRHLTCDFVPADLGLLVEDGALQGDWQLWINGTLVPSSEFKPQKLNGTDKRVVRVAHLFRPGSNTLVLRVDNAPPMGGLRTPLHLIGTFALRCAEDDLLARVITPLPPTVPFNDLVAAGLPHFSGVVRYRRTLPAGALVGVEVVELPRGFGDVAALVMDGQWLGVRAWSPYQWRVTPTAQAVEVEIAVTNTLLPFLEGQHWNTTTHTAQSV